MFISYYHLKSNYLNLYLIGSILLFNVILLTLFLSILVLFCFHRYFIVLQRETIAYTYVNLLLLFIIYLCISLFLTHMILLNNLLIPLIKETSSLMLFYIIFYFLSIITHYLIINIIYHENHIILINQQYS
jgi:hypothetical protein